MNKKLIAQLAAGEIVLDNSDHLVKESIVKNILNTARPNDDTVSGKSKYYKTGSALNRYWYAGDYLGRNNLPLIKASEFLKEDEEEFAWGEEVKHVNSDKKYFYIAKHPKKEGQLICTNNVGVLYTFFKESLSKLPSIKEVTLKEVAEKFGVSVEQIRIKE